MSGPATVTQAQIEAALQGVGLRAGDVAFVHSSLSAFGHVDGGADAVIDALRAAVGEGGTIVMPAFTWGRYHAADRFEFDVAGDSVRKEMGIIAETFRRRRGVIRSLHVCHSVTAQGPHAADVLGEGVRSFGEGSSFHALYRLDAWNVLLGVEFEVCTELHAAEEYTQVPYRVYRDFPNATVLLPNGERRPSRAVEFIRRPGYQNDFAKMGRVLAREGVLRTRRVGKATITNARIRDIFHVTVRHLQKDSGFLLTPESQRRLAEGR
jgi:aminoglycoside 3-N-acetyltransferase